MKQVRVKIVLDIEVDVDERGRIDESALKEAVFQTLEEQMEYDSLDYEFSPDDEDEDEDL